MKIWAELSFVLSQSMRLIDGRMDGLTDIWLMANMRLHCCST